MAGTAMNILDECREYREMIEAGIVRGEKKRRERKETERREREETERRVREYEESLALQGKTVLTGNEIKSRTKNLKSRFEILSSLLPAVRVQRCEAFSYAGRVASNLPMSMKVAISVKPLHSDYEKILRLTVVRLIGEVSESPRGGDIEWDVVYGRTREEIENDPLADDLLRDADTGRFIVPIEWDGNWNLIMADLKA